MQSQREQQQKKSALSYTSGTRDPLHNHPLRMPQKKNTVLLWALHHLLEHGQWASTAYLVPVPQCTKQKAGVCQPQSRTPWAAC